MLNDSVTNHTIIGSAISEASRPAEIKHAVRSKYDVKDNWKKGALPTPVGWKISGKIEKYAIPLNLREKFA